MREFYEQKICELDIIDNDRFRKKKNYQKTEKRYNFSYYWDIFFDILKCSWDHVWKGLIPISNLVTWLGVENKEKHKCSPFSVIRVECFQFLRLL